MQFMNNDSERVLLQDVQSAKNEDIKVFGKLVPASTEGVVASAANIWDDNKAKNQQDINAELDSELDKDIVDIVPVPSSVKDVTSKFIDKQYSVSDIINIIYNEGYAGIRVSCQPPHTLGYKNNNDPHSNLTYVRESTCLIIPASIILNDLSKYTKTVNITYKKDTHSDNLSVEYIYFHHIAHVEAVPYLDTTLRIAKYRNGTTKLLKYRKRVVIGGFHETNTRTYDSNISIDSRELDVIGSARFYNTVSTGALSVNGTAKICGDAYVENTLTIGNDKDGGLKCGETTISGTLHAEKDIISHSIYPKETGKSYENSDGSYKVNASNLGKGAHNFDKAFLKSIYWSDCTNIDESDTSLNGHGTDIFLYRKNDRFKINLQPQVELGRLGYDLGAIIEQNDSKRGFKLSQYSDNGEQSLNINLCDHDDNVISGFQFNQLNDRIVLGNGVNYVVGSSTTELYTNITPLVDDKVPEKYLQDKITDNDINNLFK